MRYGFTLRSWIYLPFLTSGLALSLSAQSVTLTPATLAFGNQAQGTTSATKTATLKNPLAKPLTITGIAVSGDFAQTGGTCPSSGTLAKETSCTIIVVFKPTIVGAESGTLTVTDNATSSTQTAALTGTGIAPVTLSPTSLAFGNETVGVTSPAMTVTLTNQENVTLNFTSIVASAGFAVASNTCGASIAAAATCTVGVTFKPTAQGAVSGTLTFTDSAANSSQTVSLTGTGTAAVLVSISVTPANPSIFVGANQAFAATGTYNNHTTRNITGSATWSSSLTSVATIGTSGVASGVGPGQTTIQAASGSITGSTTLTVNAPVLVSIAVTPANPSILQGGTEQFAAIGTYNNNSTKNLTSSVTWSSLAPNVATIATTGLASGVAPGQATIQAASGSVTGSTTLTVTQAFFSTGSLNEARYYDTATLLTNSLVLVTGGLGPVPGGGIGDLSSAELYNPTAGTFTLTGNLNTGRDEHTATLFNNGSVLIAGGSDGAFLASAELYNPAAGTFELTGSLNTARDEHTATLLNNGTVLIAGGEGVGYEALASAELYSPTTGKFAFTGNLNTARSAATATLLNNGMVLIAGGYGTSGPLASAELYNPTTGTFTFTGSLNTARSSATATLLDNGMVLIADGYNYNDGGPLASAELYNPTTGTFTATGSLSATGWLGTATLIGNGMVLIAGGAMNPDNSELYNATTGTFAFAGGLQTARYLQTATLLDNGSVLMAGGYAGNAAVAAAELYPPETQTPPNLVSISVTPATPTIAVGASQQFIATGTFSDNSTQQLASVTWSSSNTTVATIAGDVTNRGGAYAVAAGAATISACAGSVCGSTLLTVAAP
jgi:hypothetical protein